MNHCCLILAQQTDEQSLVRSMVLLGLGAAVFAVLVATGQLQSRIFARSPSRSGRLSEIDLGFGVILLIGALFITSVGLGLFDIDPTHIDPSDQLLIMLLSQAAMLPVVVYALVRGHLATRGGLGRFGLGLGRPKVTVAMAFVANPAVLLLTFSVMIVVTLGLNLLGIKTPIIAHDALRAIMEADRPDILRGLVISAVVVAPVVEEIIFRAFLQTTLRQSGLVRGRWAAIALASVLFTAIHFGAESWHAMPALFVLSLGLGYVYERSGSLWPSIALHAVFNGLNVAMVVAGWGSQT